MIGVGVGSAGYGVGGAKLLWGAGGGASAAHGVVGDLLWGAKGGSSSGHGVGGGLLRGARGGDGAGYGMGSEVLSGARGRAFARVILARAASCGGLLGVGAIAAPLRRRATPSLGVAPAFSAPGPNRAVGSLLRAQSKEQEAFDSGVGGEMLRGAREGDGARCVMGSEVLQGARGRAVAQFIPAGAASRSDLFVAAPLRRRATPRLLVAPAFPAAGPSRGRRALALLPRAQVEEQEAFASEEGPKTHPVKPFSLGIVKKALGHVMKSSHWAAAGGLLLFVICNILGYCSIKGNQTAKFIVNVLDHTNKTYTPLARLALLVITAFF